jgi:hypothetical protein
MNDEQITTKGNGKNSNGSKLLEELLVVSTVLIEKTKKNQIKTKKIGDNTSQADNIPIMTFDVLLSFI